MLHYCEFEWYAANFLLTPAAPGRRPPPPDDTEAFCGLIAGGAGWHVESDDCGALAIEASAGDVVIFAPGVKHRMFLTAERFTRMLGLYAVDPETVTMHVCTGRPGSGVTPRPIV